MVGKQFCRFCGAHLSEGARFCKNCRIEVSRQFAHHGRENELPGFETTSPAKKPYRIVAGVVARILILFVLATLASTCSTVNQDIAIKSTPTPSVSIIKTASTPSATPKRTAASVQTPTKGVAQNSKISNNAQYRRIYYESNQFMQPKPGDKFVSFYVTVTNINYQNGHIANPWFFTLFDLNNERREPTTSSFGESDLKTIANSYQEDKSAGTLRFEIKQNGSPMKLIYGDYENNLTINL